MFILKENLRRFILSFLFLLLLTNKRTFIILVKLFQVRSVILVSRWIILWNTHLLTYRISLANYDYDNHQKNKENCCIYVNQPCSKNFVTRTNFDIESCCDIDIDIGIWVCSLRIGIQSIINNEREYNIADNVNLLCYLLTISLRNAIHSIVIRKEWTRK